MSQREVAAWTEKDRQSTKKIKSLSAKLRAEQEEVRTCLMHALLGLLMCISTSL